MRLLVYVLIMLGIAAGAPAADTVTTQLDMNEAAYTERSDAILEMERQYKRVLEISSASPAQTARVMKSQKAWDSYREAQMDTLYGCEGHYQTYGSVLPMCRAGAETMLYQERAAILRHMADAREGDVCRWVAPCE